MTDTPRTLDAQYSKQLPCLPTAGLEKIGQIGLRVRAGLHTGECEISGNKVAGIVVHIGARVLRKAALDEVIVSAKVKDLVFGAGLELRTTENTSYAARGIPVEWRLFAAN